MSPESLNALSNFSDEEIQAVLDTRKRERIKQLYQQRREQMALVHKIDKMLIELGPESSKSNKTVVKSRTVQQTGLTASILAQIATSNKPLSAGDISQKLGISDPKAKNIVTSVLYKLSYRGRVEKVGRGLFQAKKIS